MALTQLDVINGRTQLNLFEQNKQNVRTKRKIIKQGNSHMISLPFKIARDLGMREGDYFDIEVKNGQIILTPITR